MLLGAAMEFDKKCRISLSPNTVLSAIPPSPKVDKRSSKAKPRQRRDELLIIEDNDFTEIRFNRFRSASCKNKSSKVLEFDAGVQMRRGSVYQTSGEVRSTKILGTEDVRAKIEISRSSDKYLSLRNVDSSCSSSNGNGEEDRDFTGNKSVMSSVVKLSMGYPNSRVHMARPPVDAKCSIEKDICRSLHKSVSAKVDMQQSPRQSRGDSQQASPKSRFSPIRKIMDPFLKSKSQRSPLGYSAESLCANNEVTRESLLPDDSDKMPHSLDMNSYLVEKDCCHLAKACSPTHLHGCIKFKTIDDAPVFEFSLKSPEDIFIAKSWKPRNENSWVYTLHSNSTNKQSNASSRGSKVCDTTDATIVGQMQVSSFLDSELGYADSGVGDTLTTEFVLYDIAHANRCGPALETSHSSADTFKLSKESMGSSFEEKINSNKLAAQEKLSFIDATLYPWAPTNLHPNLEVAAIVIQVPFKKTESLKHRKADQIREAQVLSSISFPKINVVASSGNHSLPESECQGPSPLLNRWRSGGGCECGGWDMTCPLIVFNNDCRKGFHLPIESKKIPTELFVQVKIFPCYLVFSS